MNTFLTVLGKLAMHPHIWIIAAAALVKYSNAVKAQKAKQRMERARLTRTQTNFEMRPPTAPTSMTTARPAPSSMTSSRPPAAAPASARPQPTAGSKRSNSGLSDANSPWSNADPFDNKKTRRR